MTCPWKWIYKKNVKKRLLVAFTPIIITCTILSALYIAGIRVNITPSLPRGVWRVMSVDPKTLKIGDTVAINKTAVSAVTLHLLKDIAAVSGDVMTLKDSSVYRNGHKIPMSTVFPVNSKGEKIQCVSYPLVVPAHHVWLGSRNERAYDSRYFGPVPIQAVMGKATLLWAW